MAAHRYWTPRYEEEHDPWNAPRSTNSASSSGTVSYARQTGAQTYSSHSWSHPIFGEAPTTTHLTDAMTCRYSQVDVQNSEQIRLQPHQGLRQRETSVTELKELFGSCEHSYGHWIDISLPHGRYPLYQLLRRFSDVAPPQARDIAPLRLVSWVSCEVPDHVQQVLNQLMVLFGAVAPVSSDEVLAIGVQKLGVTSSGEIS